MIKNSTKALFILNLFLICVIVIFIFLTFNSQPKVVYVDNVKIFNDFNMTKELKLSGEKEFNSRKAYLDSLSSKLQSSEIPPQEKKILMQEFIQKKEELEQFNQIFASEQSSKIWTRIKSYTSEFSKENKYKLIIGSENNSNVLFADEDIDVTNDLLTYINKKYEGLK